jgi:hypothetical protein
LSRKRDGQNSGLPIELPDKIEMAVPRTQTAPPPLAFGCPLNNAGTLRIIESVGAEFQPKGLKLEELRDDLLWCFIRWASLKQLGSDKLARERVERLETIAKHAEDVLSLLDNGVIGGWARKEIAMTFPLKEGAPVRITAEFRTDRGEPDAAPSFNGFLAGLGRLAEAARYKAAYFPSVALYRLPRSPTELLAASELPKVFERHFGRPPGISRPRKGGAKAHGPYIRFAVAALSELGITNRGKPYAPETVARALTDVRGGRVRRRKKR